MSNIFPLHYNIQKKLKSTDLTYYKDYQYIVGDITLLNSNLCPLKARRPCSVFPV